MSLRYRGQSYNLSLENTEDLESAFHSAHEARFGWRLEDNTIDLVHARARVSVAPASDAVKAAKAPVPTKGEALVGEQLTWFDGAEPVLTQIYDRRFIEPGTQIFGPAIIDEYTGTTVVPPGCRATLQNRALILEKAP